MKMIKTMALGFVLLSLAAHASASAPAAATADPYKGVCANGYVTKLDVSGVENVGPGWYPWLIATIDQTGFQGGVTTVNTYFTGDQQGDKKWALILGTFQTAFLSPSTAPARPRTVRPFRATSLLICARTRWTVAAPTRASSADMLI